MKFNELPSQFWYILLGSIYVVACPPPLFRYAYSMPLCSFCGVTEKQVNLCGNCRLVFYCSKECQKADWNGHKSCCKHRNPSHFKKSQKEKNIQWFLEFLEQSLIGEEGMHQLVCCLLDSFKLRCLDEKNETGHQFVSNDDLHNKFYRFLHAARGSMVLPEHFTKTDTATACHFVRDQHMMEEITEEKVLDGLYHKYTEERLEQLRQLHFVICGPIVIGSSEFNII